MDRRGFFRRGVHALKETAVQEAGARARRRATRWIRPPFALDELEFLLACTRCRDCIEACPFAVIFPLSPRLGARVAGTPALDLLQKGCHLCDAWPCVAACETGALRRPPDTAQPPRLALARINPARCLPYTGPECGACAASCSLPGALLWEGERPRIDPERCTGCARCREACIVEPKAVEIRSAQG